MAKKHHRRPEYKDPDQMEEATQMMMGVTKFAVAQQASMGVLGMMSGMFKP